MSKRSCNERDDYMEIKANRVFMVNENMTKQFMSTFNTPMISKDFYEKCKEAAKGVVACKKEISKKEK